MEAEEQVRIQELLSLVAPEVSEIAYTSVWGNVRTHVLLRWGVVSLAKVNVSGDGLPLVQSVTGLWLVTAGSFPRMVWRPRNGTSWFHELFTWIFNFKVSSVENCELAFTWLFLLSVYVFSSQLWKISWANVRHYCIKHINCVSWNLAVASRLVSVLYGYCSVIYSRGHCGL